MECQVSKVLWLCSRWALRLDSFHHLSLEDWLIIILLNGLGLCLDSSDAKHFLIFAAVLMDMTWFSCNRVVFDKVELNPTELLLSIEKLSLEHLHSCYSRYRPVEAHSKPIWIPPPQGWVKINFDVAIRHSLSVLAAIFRDSAGHFLFAWTSLDGPLEPMVAEAKVACFALSNAWSSHLFNIILEGDAAVVLDTLAHEDLTPPWAIASPFFDARILLCNFNFWVVHTVPHRANSTAHELAQWAAQWAAHCNRFGPIPISDLPCSVLFEEAEIGDCPILPS
ncbi:hypothetical protein L1049_011666 [Liquidambar formosana]|uniref:RNase H type-1 domain-containing protein n=1 Tax=Liquidambar formosana TaxID=63359 RepID=A0AAP0RSA2_LIQFO